MANTSIVVPTGERGSPVSGVSFTPFPVFALYEAIATLRGFSAIPASNTGYWDKPVYPTSFTSIETSLADTETVANSAAPGDVIAISTATHTQNDINITNSGTQANPIFIVMQNLGQGDLSDSVIQYSGDWIYVMGVVNARHNVDGQDNLTAYTRRNAAQSIHWVSDGARNRNCYNLVEGLTADDQYWNVVSAGGAKVDNRIDHNHHLRHIGNQSPGGASEHGQVGQNQIEENYRLLYDSNYSFSHLNNGDGVKTVTNESEMLSLKSSQCMILNNFFKDHNSHVSLRTGRETTVWGNWFSGAGADQMGGIVGGGQDNLIGCNYGIDLNAGELAGESFIDVFGGDGIGQNREQSDRTEVFCNTAYNCGNVLSLNRSNYTVKPTDVELHGNALQSKDATNVLWENDSTTPNFGANVFGPNKGIADADVLEATPGWTLSKAGVINIYDPTPSGNLDGTLDAISATGTMVRSLQTSGALFDLVGQTIPSTGGDQSAIQAGYDWTFDPIAELIADSGYLA